MLKLINITRNNNIIEADYIPENGEEKAHVKLDITTDAQFVENIEAYGSMYGRMALNGLRRTVEELDSGKIDKVPAERTVMWY
jgi:hypothetical protein